MISWRFTLAFLIFYLAIYLCVFIYTGYWYRKWSRHVRSIINGDAHCPSRASDSPHAIHKLLSVVVRWPQRWLTTSLWYILSLPIQEALPSLLIEVQRYILSVVKDCFSRAPRCTHFSKCTSFFDNKTRSGLCAWCSSVLFRRRGVYSMPMCVCVSTGKRVAMLCVMPTQTCLAIISMLEKKTKNPPRGLHLVRTRNGDRRLDPRQWMPIGESYFYIKTYIYIWVYSIPKHPGPFPLPWEISQQAAEEDKIINHHPGSNQSPFLGRASGT